MKSTTRRKLKVTDKQKQARNAVDVFIGDKGYPPTYREVAELLGVASSNTAYARLRGYRNKMIKN